MNEPIIYSYVVPVYNEAEVLHIFFEQIEKVLDQLDSPYEVIFIDDGSKDDSFRILKAKIAQEPRFKVIRFSRNFGHQTAVTAGLDMAAGKCAIVLDADLQDPPEVTLKMIALWKQGSQVVYGVRKHREGEAAAMQAVRRLFYKAINCISEVDLPLDAGDFRLIDRTVLDCLRRMREHNRYVRGLTAWVGFRQDFVEYERPQRAAGESKYSIRKLIRLGSDGIFSFSAAPLTFALYLGLSISLLSFLSGVVAFVAKFINPDIPAGWTSLVILVSFFSGVILLVLGICGLYLSRIYEEVKNRPIYIAAESIGITAITEPSRVILRNDH